jgi:hypothetical protein
MNLWIEKVKAYHSKHPELTYKECMIKLSKKRKHGGNPLAAAEAISGVADSVGNLATAIGDQVDKGRRTTHEISKENGGIEVDRASNTGEREKKFQQFYRDMMHKRFWDGDSLPPRLRWPREKTNNPKYADEQEKKDDALYAYCEKVFGRS